MQVVQQIKNQRVAHPSTLNYDTPYQQRRKQYKTKLSPQDYLRHSEQTVCAFTQAHRTVQAHLSVNKAKLLIINVNINVNVDNAKKKYKLFFSSISQIIVSSIMMYPITPIIKRFLSGILSKWEVRDWCYFFRRAIVRKSSIRKIISQIVENIRIMWQTLKSNIINVGNPGKNTQASKNISIAKIPSLIKKYLLQLVLHSKKSSIHSYTQLNDVQRMATQQKKRYTKKSSNFPTQKVSPQHQQLKYKKLSHTNDQCNKFLSQTLTIDKPASYLQYQRFDALTKILLQLCKHKIVEG